MRVDNQIYWNLFQSMFTETTQCFQKCGQQTKKTVTESKNTLWVKEHGRMWAKSI